MLLDISKSMETGQLDKFHYAQRLAAALCYVGLVRLDSICLQPFSGKLHDAFTASGGRHRFQPAMTFLSALQPAGQTNFLECSRQFCSKYPQRGLTMVISDFLDDRDCEKPLQYLSDFGHELILLQIWADEDREPPWEGELELEDAETGQKVELAFDSDARAQYTAAFDAHCDLVRKVAERNSGRYLGVSTSIPIEQAIFGPLVKSGAVA
jgi:uncharacterized protein (DUF58 family)